MGGGMVELVAVAGFARLGDEIGVSQPVSMLAARPVTVFALNIAEVLQHIRHGRPVSGGQYGWENPAGRLHDIVEPAIGGGCSGIIADGVAREAGCAITAQVDTQGVVW